MDAAGRSALAPYVKSATRVFRRKTLGDKVASLGVHVFNVADVVWNIVFAASLLDSELLIRGLALAAMFLSIFVGVLELSFWAIEEKTNCKKEEYDDDDDDDIEGDEARGMFFLTGLGPATLIKILAVTPDTLLFSSSLAPRDASGVCVRIDFFEITQATLFWASLSAVAAVDEYRNAGIEEWMRVKLGEADDGPGPGFEGIQLWNGVISFVLAIVVFVEAQELVLGFLLLSPTIVLLIWLFTPFPDIISFLYFLLFPPALSIWLLIAFLVNRDSILLTDTLRQSEEPNSSGTGRGLCNPELLIAFLFAVSVLTPLCAWAGRLAGYRAKDRKVMRRMIEEEMG